MGDHGEAVDYCNRKELGDAVAAIKKSGKAKFVGFSTHNLRRAEYIRAAAEGGFIDVIMVQYTIANSRTASATGRAPTSRLPGPPARVNWTSPCSCPK
jgi:predicted aldo/keto reductase-like oxidoreductase